MAGYPRAGGRGRVGCHRIAERCALLLPSLSRILQNLHKRGLVSRKTASSDQRRSIVSITARGRKLFRTLSPVNEARYAYITQKFGYGKLELLYELLNELVEKLTKTRRRPMSYTVCQADIDAFNKDGALPCVWRHQPAATGPTGVSRRGRHP